ncbi:hypothetical protein D3C72_869990 [compost metagenome]
MDALAQDGAGAGGVEDQPLDRLPARLEVGRQQASGLLGQVQQYGGGFEEDDAGLVVGDDGNSTVGIQRQEGRGSMVAVVDLHMVKAVGKAQLFQGDGGLVAVWRGRGVEGDHRACRPACG